MSYITSDDEHYKEAGETRNCIVSFAKLLDKDNSINERIASITSVSASSGTAASSAITPVPRIVNGREVPAGKAITFTLAGGSNGTPITVTCTVVSTGGQTLVRKLTVNVQSS
jgi:hypothetical protein